MTKRLAIPFVVLAAAVVHVAGPSARSFAQTAAARPADAEIRAMLTERLVPGTDTGIIVGIVGPTGRQVIAAGKAGPGGLPVLDARTVFEIGSATKVFTGALLMDMVRRGEVRLDDPVAKYLPASVKVPSREGREITLLDLATHTSGLPRLPSNLSPKDQTNPYADYSVAQLYQFLSGYQLPRNVGERFEYSNLGMGLLGHVLALRAGIGYEGLLRARILGPLQMRDTAISLSPSQQDRLAVGHDAAGRAVANWDIPTLAGAGALRSTLDDMLRFLEANLAVGSGPLGSVLSETHAVRRAAGTPDMSIGLAWLVRRAGDREIVWHNGGTGGYHSFIGFDASARIGVVVLHNSTASIDDIGFRLLGVQVPAAQPPTPPKARTEVKLDASVLEGYVGEYRLSPTVTLVVTREADQLFIQVTGQSRFPIYPESETDFFLKVLDAQITFSRDPGGRATSLVVHQNGRNTPGQRIRQP